MDAFLELIRFDLWRTAVLDWGGRALTALLILFVGLWLARRIGKLVALGVTRRGGDAVLANFLKSTVRIGLTVLVVIGALDRAGVPTASLLAALGAAGLAIGLALRDSLSNIASGVLLVMTRPFRAGDFVDIAGQSGTVERIDLLRTLLVSVDNRVITLPNAQVMGHPIINFSARPERRLDLPVQIDYANDPAEALRVIREVLDSHPRVLREREPQLLVRSFGASGVDIVVRPWVRTADVLVAQSEVLAAIKQALDDAGIVIPYPQQVMRLVQDGPAAPLPVASAPTT
jgi:small-conductance mechanosensitive channel